MPDPNKDINKYQDDGANKQSGFLRRRFSFFLSRADSIKWMLRGLLFIPIVMVVDLSLIHI